MPRKLQPKIEGYDDGTAAILLGISRRSLLRYLKAGIVSPPGVMMGKNRRAWREHDVQHAKTQLRERVRARATS
jgi:predicted DNA-binding transcriptional regulator AlpA